MGPGTQIECSIDLFEQSAIHTYFAQLVFEPVDFD